jgi:hypothetical protein
MGYQKLDPGRRSWRDRADQRPALVIADHPIVLQLGYLRTLLEIGDTNSATIVFPAPS